MKAMFVIVAATAATAALAVAAPASAAPRCGRPQVAHHTHIAYHPIKRHLVRRAAVRTVYVTRVVRVPVAYPAPDYAPPRRHFVEYRHGWRHHGYDDRARYERRDAEFSHPRSDWREDVYRY